MKNKLFASLAILFLAVAPRVYAIPVMNVIVSDANARLAYKGLTNRDGTFATSKLATGTYVVRFVSKGAVTKDNQYMLILAAGKKSLISNGVAADKFKASGVAATMEVDKASKITGQVADAQELEKEGVKVVNGHRFRWVAGRIGEGLGGRWVEGDSSQNVSQINAAGFRQLQDRAGLGAAARHSPDYYKAGGGH